MTNGKDIQKRHNVGDIEAERLFEADPSSDSMEQVLTETPAPLQYTEAPQAGEPAGSAEEPLQAELFGDGNGINQQRLKGWKELPKKNKKAPKNFAITRSLTIDYPMLEEEFLTKQEGDKTLSRTVVGKYLPAFILAVCKRLYNDSYAVGKWDKKTALENTGKYTLDGDLFGGQRVRIDISRAELMEFITQSHPTQSQVQKMEKVIKEIHATPLSTLDHEGTGDEIYLITISEKKVKKYKTTNYSFSLHPIFYRLAKGYGSHPEGIGAKLLATAGIGISGEDTKLLMLLGQQNKKKPFTIEAKKLAKYLGMSKEYNKNRKRAEDKIQSKLDHQIDIGMITDYTFDPESTDITINFNPTYGGSNNSENSEETEKN